MSTVLPRRRGVARATGILVASVVAGGGIIASTVPASAEDNEISVSVDTFIAADFAEVAADLPAGLIEAIQRDLDLSPAEYLARAETAKSAADAVAGLRVAGVGVIGASIDGDDVTLHVKTEADVDAATATGAKVEVGGLAAFKSDRKIQPAADHKGGYGYAYALSEPDENGEFFLGRCSVGFSGYDADGNDRFLTAGHCGRNEETQEQYTTPISHIDLDAPIWGTSDWTTDFPGPDLGEFVPGSVHYGELQDGALVDITNDDWAGVPAVAGWNGGAGDPDDASVNILGSIAPVVGADACKSGATSGWTCGEILVPEQTVAVGDEDVSGFVFSACMLGGDSGGSIVVGSYALGVNSGSSHDGRTNCDTWDPATVENTDGDFGIGYAVSAGTHNANTLFDGEWELSVSINTPTVTAPADGGETGPTPTFAGTVQGARSTHRVHVVVDGEHSYTGQIAGDGSFSVPVTDALEPGEHSYEVTATYGQFSRSDAAEGSFTSTELQVEALTVTAPTEGQTTGSARPTFTGTGHPGATVKLTVGKDGLGEVVVGEDGKWTITPRADLPVGERFDATITQTFEDDVQTATVAGLGVKAPAVTVTAPADGSSVAGDVVFAGTVFPAATLTLSIEGAVTASAGSVQAAAETAADEWAGELKIGDDGAWTFTPAAALEQGEYTLTASAAVDGGDQALTSSETSVSFTVADDSGDSGDAGGAEDGTDLPDTGSSNTWLIFVGIGLLVLGGAAVAIRARRNRNAA